jgi:hypothetical protein
MTYTTKEGSLICLMTGNKSNISSINAQRSDSTIGQVYFCFKRDGRTNKRESTLGKWSQFKKTIETNDSVNEIERIKAK